MKVCVLLCVSPLQPCLCVCVRAWMLVGHLCQCLKDKMHLDCIWACVYAVCAAEESFSKSRLAALVFTMSLQLQRPFNLKTSQFESLSNIWPAFLPWLNDWMHLHRFLLTSSPIWNLVPVRSAENAHIQYTRANTGHTHKNTHLRLRLQKPLSVRLEQRRDLGMISV